jgi:hypothetical protein
MQFMGEPDAYARTLSGIKQLLDPSGILAPGRYVAADGAAQHPSGTIHSSARTNKNN